MLLPLLFAAAPQVQEPPVTQPPVQHLVAVEVTQESQPRFQALDMDVAYMDRFAGVAQVIVTTAEIGELERAGAGRSSRTTRCSSTSSLPSTRRS